MEFHEFPTLWKYFREAFKNYETEEMHKSPESFYKNICRTIENYPGISRQFGLPSSSISSSLKQDKIVYNQSLSERLWYQNDQLYYRVHPKIVEIFSEAQMESIPCSLLDMEIDKPFVILLSKQDETLKIDEIYGLRSCLVHRTTVEDKQYLTAWIDFGETCKDVMDATISVPVLTFKTILWRNGNETINEVFDGLEVEKESANIGLKLNTEFQMKVFRLVCSVHFLVKNESPLIEPDVLSKDLRDYYSSNEKERFAQKAWKKRGKKGWKVGTERSFSIGLLPAPPIKSSTSGENEGKELSYAHIRKPHWHLVRHGKGKSQAKVIWYFPTVVRPDLPFRKN